MRRPVGVGLGATAALLRRAPGDPGAMAALSGALRRLPAALRVREPLPERVESSIRLLENTEREGS
jgi:hypothetical protein